MPEKQATNKSNISSIFLSTAIAMIITEITEVITSLIDGIVSGRYLDIAVFSSISLLKPFSKICAVISGFLSTGCNIVCSRLVGTGNKEEANQVFNLCIQIGLFFSMIIVLLCRFFPIAIFCLSGISLAKYPELVPDMLDYLKGFMLGIPAHVLCAIIGPVLVMDNGKDAFARSSFVLCVSDIACGLLNVFVFHDGAFGMGLASSISHVAQFAVLLPLLFNRNRYFFLSLHSSLNHLPEIVRNGSPAFIKKLAVAFRDSSINYLNLAVALNAAAIAARGIQNDLFAFFFCISIGLGRTLLTMTGMYYGANDRKGLTDLYSYAMKLGILMTGIVSILIFLFAPWMSLLYTEDPMVLSLSVFSIRWMALSLVFDTIIALVQYYLQGIGNMKLANTLTVLERFIIPVACAFVFGYFFGSKGILASIAIGKFLLFTIMIIINVIHLKRFPRSLADLMYLPDDFSKEQTDNLYARMSDLDEVIRTSEDTREFCLKHGIDKKQAFLMSLCVEEMATGILERAQRNRKKHSSIDYRLMINDTTICFHMNDLGELFDPISFYELHQHDSPEQHIGLRLVMKAAKEVRYYSSFNSNNLIVILDRIAS